MAGADDRMAEVLGEERWQRLKRAGRWAARSYVVIVILGIVVGLQIAPAVSDLASNPVSGTVAVVTLSGAIDGQNAASVGTRLARARESPEVDAVVLRVNSGGGSASASEDIFMEVKRTAARKPVVVSVDALAASGAYYAAAPGDAIFVKPGSFVGSVGVYFVAPEDTPPIDALIQTGPNKLSGADRREWEYKVETARQAFAGAVVANRGETLELTEAELSYAKLYSGAEAVDNGIADRTGNAQDAIEDAADRAGLSRYRVRVLGYNGTVTFVTQTAYLASAASNKELVSPAYFVADPGTTAVPNLLMLPPTVVEAAIRDELAPATASTPAGNGPTPGVGAPTPGANTTGVTATDANATR